MLQYQVVYYDDVHDIRLEQKPSGLFRVTYGKSTVDYRTYANAAQELGECLMHALACEGKLNNDF